MFNYPDNFKIYGENYQRYQEVQQHFQDSPAQEALYLEKDRQVVEPSHDMQHTSRKYK